MDLQPDRFKIEDRKGKGAFFAGNTDAIALVCFGNNETPVAAKEQVARQKLRKVEKLQSI